MSMLIGIVATTLSRIGQACDFRNARPPRSRTSSTLMQIAHWTSDPSSILIREFHTSVEGTSVCACHGFGQGRFGALAGQLGPIYESLSCGK